MKDEANKFQEYFAQINLVDFVQKQTVFEAQMIKTVLQTQHWQTNMQTYLEKNLHFVFCID